MSILGKWHWPITDENIQATISTCVDSINWRSRVSSAQMNYASAESRHMRLLTGCGNPVCLSKKLWLVYDFKSYKRILKHISKIYIRCDIWQYYIKLWPDFCWFLQYRIMLTANDMHTVHYIHSLPWNETFSTRSVATSHFTRTVFFKNPFQLLRQCTSIQSPPTLCKSSCT